MPLVRINMLKGQSPAQKKAILDAVHDGLISSLGIEDWDRFQRILEYEPEDFEAAPGKTGQFVIIEITLFPGRTKEQKRKAIENITANLANTLGIEPTDVFIIMSEPGLENWGIGGRQKG